MSITQSLRMPAYGLSGQERAAPQPRVFIPTGPWKLGAAVLGSFAKVYWLVPDIQFTAPVFARLDSLLLLPISALPEHPRQSIKRNKVSGDWRALPEADSLGNDSHLCKINDTFIKQASGRIQWKRRYQPQRCHQITPECQKWYQ